MITANSIRDHLQTNGFHLTVLHSLRTLWTRSNSALLAHSFGVNNIRVESPFRLNGRRFMTLGNNFFAGPGLWLEAISNYNQRTYQPSIIIGDNVSLSHNVHIAATTYVELGSDVLIGSRVLITDHNHGAYSGPHQSPPSQSPLKRPLEQGRRTIIGSRVWLGDGVVVTAGAIIGEGAVIGANSVVVGLIPPDCMASGIPAKVFKTYNKEDQLWQKV